MFGPLTDPDQPASNTSTTQEKQVSSTTSRQDISTLQIGRSQRPSSACTTLTPTSFLAQGRDNLACMELISTMPLARGRLGAATSNTDRVPAASKYEKPLLISSTDKAS